MVGNDPDGTDKDLASAVEKFNRLKDGTAKPKGKMKRVVARDPFGRIDAVIESEVTLEDPQAPVAKSAEGAMGQAAVEVVRAATEIVRKITAQKVVTATELSQDVAAQVTETAREVAREALEDVIGDVIAEATDGLPGFKRRDDEDPEEDDDFDALEVARNYLADPQVFKSPAKIRRDRQQREEEIVAGVVAKIGRQLARTTALVDGIAAVVDEFDGNLDNIQEFFRVMRAKPLSDPDHPFVTEPRLRVFAFPGADESAGRLSNETSAEYDPDDDPNEPTDQMALRPRRRQPKHDPLDQNGSEDYRDHKAPQADAVMLSKIAKRRWNGRRFE